MTTVSPTIQAMVDRGFECWNSGNLDDMRDMYAEDAEYDPSGVFVDQAPVRGEQLTPYWREVWEIWEGVGMEPLEVVPVAPTRFVVSVRLWGRGKRSGAEVDQRYAILYETRESDGKIVRAKLYPDAATAQAAAGEVSADAAS